MSIGLTPIKRKAPVAESTICAQIDVVEFTEIVCIQLKEISQDRLLLRRGGENREVRA